MRTYESRGETTIDGPHPDPSNIFPKVLMTQSIEESVYYRFEKNRLDTFDNWSSTYPIDKARLAKAGFFYIKERDTVKCFSCKISLSNWIEGDSAYHRHKNASPNCAFVKGNSDNEPMISNFRNSSNNSAPMIRMNGHSPNGTAAKPAKTTSNTTTIQNGHLANGNYHLEECRLRTFKDWPHTFLSTEKLAESGFYFLHQGDRVQCAFCHGIVHGWEPNDDPMEEHRRHFPFCQFVQGKAVTNVVRNKRVWYSKEGGGQDVAGNAHLRKGPSSLRSTQPSPLKQMGINELTGPCHLSHASEDIRYRSFASWKNGTTVAVKDLVEAGFFYLGMKDCVKCFYCDGGLCNWMPGDDPWREHARWFPNCAFVQLNKGQEFIEDCIKDRPPVEPEVDVSQEPSTSQSPVHLARNIDQLMQSDMIKMFLEAEVFPYQIVHAAVARQLQETGRGFDTEDELCQAVMFLQLNEDASAETMEDIPVMGAPPALEATLVKSEASTSSQQAATTDIETPTSTSCCQEEQGSPVSQTPEAKSPTRSGDTLLCKICMDKEVGMVFLPCGHLMACTRCGPALKQCPLCRRTIQGAVRTFLS